MRGLVVTPGLLLVVALMVSWSEASANPFKPAIGIAQIAEFKPASPRNSILPGRSKPRFGDQQAAARAKQRYPGNKILSVNLRNNSNAPSYRVKMLSTGGVVKYVFVDASTGEVFE